MGGVTVSRLSDINGATLGVVGHSELVLVALGVASHVHVMLKVLAVLQLLAKVGEERL